MKTYVDIFQHSLARAIGHGEYNHEFSSEFCEIFPFAGDAAGLHVARLHIRSGRDIPAEYYDTWLDSLIEALGEFDPEFDADVELSWRLVLAPGISYMKFMHDRC